MKRLVLLIAACCCFIAMTNAQVERKVMVEHFTNASCGPCAVQNPAFNALLRQNEDRVITLKYQTNFPGFDPMNQQNPAEVYSRRVNYYSIFGVPTATIDGVIPGDSYGGGVGGWNVAGGGYAGGPYGYNQAVLNYAMNQPTNISIELGHSLTVKLDTIFISCKVKNLGDTDFTPSSGRLHIAVTEEAINFASPPGSNGERDFYHVMRKMIPDANGTPISSIPAKDSLVFDIAFPLPSYLYNYSEVGVVAFVQDNANKRIFQAERSVKQDLPQGGSYARVELEDRTAAPATPCEGSVNPKILVRNTLSAPLTAFTVSYQIDDEDPVSQDWTGNLDLNELVVVNFGDVPLEVGTHLISYEISNLNNDPDVINLDPAATVTIPGLISALPTDAIGTSSTYDLESEAVYAYPDNAVTSNIEGIGRTFQTVDKSAFNSANPIGAYGQSDKSLLIDYFGWDPSATGLSQATLTLAKVDLTNYDNAYFKMDRAYARYPGALDQLQILISTDCGERWTIVANRAGGGFATAPTQQTGFVPAADQWETDSFDISDYVGQEVTLGLRAVSGHGNRAFIDNIQISGDVATGTSTVNLLTGKVNIFPNPVSELKAATIEFELVEPSSVDITIFDPSGKQVATLAQGKSYGAGTHISTWENISERGIYFVKIKTNYGELTQKLTVF